jgi:hypothetical protein
MFPENNQPAPQVSSDYLNQIAPKAPRKSLIPKSTPVKLGLIALVVIILVTVIGMLASVASSSIGDSERLAARLLSTQSVVELAKPNIKNTKLRAMNSDLSIYLSNTIRDAKPILAKSNININKLSKNVTVAESDAKLLATLEDARLNAVYDRIYASEMAHQLDTTLILMRQILNSTRSTSLKAFLQNTYQTLQPTQKQFEDFNAND